MEDGWSGETQNIGKNVNEILVVSSLRQGPKHGEQVALNVEGASGGMFELQHGTLYRSFTASSGKASSAVGGRRATAGSGRNMR